MYIYKTTRGQLYTIWFFAITGWLFAGLDRALQESTLSGYLLILIPATTIFYTVGWRNKNGLLIPALKKLPNLTKWCLNKVKRLKFTRKKKTPLKNTNEISISKSFEIKVIKTAKTIRAIAILTISYFTLNLTHSLSLTEYDFKFNPESIGFIAGFSYGLFGISLITLLLGACILVFSSIIIKNRTHIIQKANLMFFSQLGIIITLSMGLGSDKNLLLLLVIVLIHFIFYSIPTIRTKKY